MDRPGVIERIHRLITIRLAEDTQPVTVHTTTGQATNTFAVLPLLERDRDAFTKTIEPGTIESGTLTRDPNTRSFSLNRKKSG
ncbi:MAG: hypothetical protein KDB86_13170 [Actinobacteria bacterium]|nr:hypothetical protein [Actinomycetota bacterium]MCB9390669.1 hypothetical protein [Acidimicrobiia bacterium]